MHRTPSSPIYIPYSCLPFTTSGFPRRTAFEVAFHSTPTQHTHVESHERFEHLHDTSDCYTQLTQAYDVEDRRLRQARPLLLSPKQPPNPHITSHTQWSSRTPISGNASALRCTTTISQKSSTTDRISSIRTCPLHPLQPPCRLPRNRTCLRPRNPCTTCRLLRSVYLLFRAQHPRG